MLGWQRGWTGCACRSNRLLSTYVPLFFPFEPPTDRSGGGQQVGEHLPSRAKRSARAYHDQGQAPTPSAYDDNLARERQGAPQQLHTDQFGTPSHQHTQQQSNPPAHDPRTPQSRFPPAPTYIEPGIPQPPHSAGQRIAANQRIKIDPDHIPSPVAVQEADQQPYSTEPYMTCSRSSAPLATTDFVAIDQGPSSSSMLALVGSC